MANLEESLDRAKMLMSMDGKLNNIAASKRAQVMNEELSGGDEDYGWDDPMLGSMGTSQPMIPSAQQSQPVSADALQQRMMSQGDFSKLPPSIAKIMQDNPVDVSSLSGSAGDTTALLSRLSENNKTKNLMKENGGDGQGASTQPVAQAQGVGGVDYSLIKSIVDSAISSALEKLKDGSALKTLKIGDGNKIQFLDKGGNLYEATLTFKKNISKK